MIPHKIEIRILLRLGVLLFIRVELQGLFHDPVEIGELPFRHLLAPIHVFLITT